MNQSELLELFRAFDKRLEMLEKSEFQVEEIATRQQARTMAFRYVVAEIAFKLGADPAAFDRRIEILTARYLDQLLKLTEDVSPRLGARFDQREAGEVADSLEDLPPLFGD